MGDKEAKRTQSGIPTKFRPVTSATSNDAIQSSKKANTTLAFGGMGGGTMTCSTVQRHVKGGRIFETSINNESNVSALSSVAKSARGVPLYTCSTVNTEKFRSRSSVRQPVSALARRSLFASTSRLEVTSSGVGGLSTFNTSSFQKQGTVRCWKQDPRRDPKNDREYRSSILNRIRAACFANGLVVDIKSLDQPVSNTFFEVFDTLANGASRTTGVTSASASASAATASNAQYSTSAMTSQLGGGYNTMNRSGAVNMTCMLPMCNVLPRKTADPKKRKAEVDERTKEVVNVLMQLGYPFTVARDMSSVSAAHSWPRLLLALGYLADCNIYARALNVDRLMFPRSKRVFQDDSILLEQAGGDDAALGIDEDALSEFEFMCAAYRCFLLDDQDGAKERQIEFRESALSRYDETNGQLEKQLEKLTSEVTQTRTNAAVMGAIVNEAIEQKKRVAAKEQRCKETLVTNMENAEKELNLLRMNVSGLNKEHDACIQRSNELRTTIRNQERAQLNAKLIMDERSTMERELNALENARFNIEQQARTVELQISEQVRVNSMLSEQYEQAAINANLLPSTARFAAGRDFEMKLTYSNVSCCSEVLAGLDQVYVELNDALRRNDLERADKERELNILDSEIENINLQCGITQSCIETMHREAAQRRIIYGEERETRTSVLRKLKRELEELECSKATREKAIETEQAALFTQAELALSEQRLKLDTVCNEYRLKKKEADANYTEITELVKEQRKLLEASKRHVESGQLQELIRKWTSVPFSEIPHLLASTSTSTSTPTLQSTSVVDNLSEQHKKS